MCIRDRNKYCPIGSSSPKEVPEGYIAGPDSSPITQKSELMNCTAGFYCSGGSDVYKRQGKENAIEEAVSQIQTETLLPLWH